MAGTSDPFDDENDEDLSEQFQFAAEGFTMDDLVWAQKETRAFLLPTHEEAQKFRDDPQTPICITHHQNGEIIAGYARKAYETTIESLSEEEWALIGLDLKRERLRIDRLKAELNLGEDAPLTYIVFDVQRHVVLKKAGAGFQQKLANPDFVLRLNS